MQFSHQLKNTKHRENTIRIVKSHDKISLRHEWLPCQLSINLPYPLSIYKQKWKKGRYEKEIINKYTTNYYYIYNLWSFLY